MKEKTICAISTAFGNSAISIIRMSGQDSLAIAKKYFIAKSLNFDKITPRYLYLGTFACKEIAEKCLMVYFKAPNSYTGEDIVEFQIHGGEFLARKILDIISKDCELASPGEFSKRAFLNGKLSLSEAEGVVDVINSESEAELNSAYALSTGRFNKKINEFQSQLTELLARIEVALDYPEHDEELITVGKAKEILNSIQQEVEKLVKNSESGDKIKSGVNVAIAGSPNVGKSSLLNAMLEKDRAIVSSVEGTTRDTLSETIVYNGMKFNLIDTAGIREKGDEVEKLGIERAKKEAENADIILFVVDLSRQMTAEEKTYLKSLNKDKVVIILNKTDISVQKNDLNGIEISAKNDKNIEKVKRTIYEKTLKDKIDLSKIVLTNMRHVNILKEVLQEIKETLKDIDNVMLDMLAYRIKDMWNNLGKITGETENEEIINEIFSKFCLGK